LTKVQRQFDGGRTPWTNGAGKRKEGKREEGKQGGRKGWREGKAIQF
jgi:hypothetical protein